MSDTPARWTTEDGSAFVSEDGEMVLYSDYQALASRLEGERLQAEAARAEFEVAYKRANDAESRLDGARKVLDDFDKNCFDEIECLSKLDDAIRGAGVEKNVRCGNANCNALLSAGEKHVEGCLGGDVERQTPEKRERPPIAPDEDGDQSSDLISIRGKTYRVMSVTWAVDQADKIGETELRANVDLEPVKG